MSVRWAIVLGAPVLGALVALSIVVAWSALDGTRAEGDGAFVVARSETHGGLAMSAPQRQETPANGGQDDQRVPVQVWTIVAAAGTAVLGLGLYALRRALGLVPPPPTPEMLEQAQHHALAGHEASHDEGGS
jgi:hypothetical protein